MTRFRRLLTAAAVTAVLLVTGAVLVTSPASAANSDTMTFPGNGTLRVAITTTPAGKYDPRTLLFLSGSDDSTWLCDSGYCAAQQWTTPYERKGSIFDFALGENDGNESLSNENAFSVAFDGTGEWTFTRLLNQYNPFHFDYTVRVTFQPGVPPTTDPTPTAPATPLTMTVTPTTSELGAAYDVAGFKAQLTDEAGKPWTGVFVSWRVVAGPDIGLKGANVTDGNGIANIAYSRASDSYTAPSSTDDLEFWYEQINNGEPDPTEPQASASWTFAAATPRFTCPDNGHTGSAVLPKVDVDPPALLHAVKPFTIEYGNLPLTFTTGVAGSGSYCTTTSNRGHLPVNVVFPIKGVPYHQHVADSVAVATLDFLPAATTDPQRCDFSVLKRVNNAIQNGVFTPPPGTNNCLLNDRSNDSSHSVIARWTNPGFEEYLALGIASPRVFATRPLTYYVDLESLFGDRDIDFDDLVQRVETFYHLTLIASLPIIDTMAVVQDPPARISVTDAAGNTVGRLPDGSLSTYANAGYAEVDDRSIAVISGPAAGGYRVVASGSAGTAYSVDFVMVNGGSAEPTVDSVRGTIGSGGTATSTFQVVGGAVTSSIAAVSGGGQSAIVGRGFAKPLVVKVSDAAGQPVAGRTVTFAVTSGSATIGGKTSMTAVTNAQGLATSPPMLAGSRVGAVRISATVGTASTAFGLSVVAAADLSVRFGSVKAVTAGKNLRVTVTVTNSGPSAASKLSTTVTLPRGVTVVSAGGGRKSGATLRFTTTTVRAGGKVTYTFTVRPASAAKRGARLTAKVASAVKDPRTANNAAASGAVKR
ncbi:CARDB domain-containing protein [Actinoplanes sp. HUAS TT8]|uniref:CARDB domain-containing protein n=1 Tax=Actinoplanes sp. HUAS TT8 TaxID=3447453 RepID=UPI003F51B632